MKQLSLKMNMFGKRTIQISKKKLNKAASTTSTKRNQKIKRKTNVTKVKLQHKLVEKKV